MDIKLDFEKIFPEGTFLALRTSMEMVYRVFKGDFRLDAVTGNTITIMGNMPLICSENVASPLILDFLKRSGLKTPANLLTYKDQEQAVDLARGLFRRGLRLAYAYPPPSELHTEELLLVPVPLYNWLNDKTNLGSLVEPGFLPPHLILGKGCSSIPQDIFPGSRLFVKACFPGACGAGNDVLYCPDNESRQSIMGEWVSAKREGISCIRVEKALDIEKCWCLNLVIDENGSRYLGSAIQLFGSPAKQRGSRIDPENVPPDPAVTLALSIAERARCLGYRGVAGFDIGVDEDETPFVFDLNFRMVSCTPQVLLHNAAVERVDARISESWSFFVTGALEPALDRISCFAEKGHFIPIRLYEGTFLSGGRSLITGIAVANTLEEIEWISFRMKSILGDLLYEQ